MNRRPIPSWLWLFLVFSPLLPAQGLDQLAQSTADSVLQAVAGGVTPDVTVIRLENHSFLTDADVQKLYHTVAARLETSPAIRFHDSLLAIQDGRGQFGQAPRWSAQFLVALTLVTSRSRVGIGTAVFSRRLDRLASFKYWETEIGDAELLALRTLDGSFAQSGFSLEREIEVQPHLLDVAADREEGGETRYYFLYPHVVEVFTVEEKALRRVFSIPLVWGRPFYPTQTPEGRILALRNGKELFLTVGTNSSPESLLFSRQGGTWSVVRRIPFVPFGRFTVNRNLFLVGAPYAPGRNYFAGSMLFLPWPPAADGAPPLEKTFPPFYAADFALKDGTIQGINLVDTTYLLRLYEADFSERPVDPEPRGAQLAVCQDAWLAQSAHSRGSDHLQIAAVQGGGRRFLYRCALNGEIGFIRAGNWENRPGFWVLLEQREQRTRRSTLQFWGAPGAQ